MSLQSSFLERPRRNLFPRLRAGVAVLVLVPRALCDARVYPHAKLGLTTWVFVRSVGVLCLQVLPTKQGRATEK